MPTSLLKATADVVASVLAQC